MGSYKTNAQSLTSMAEAILAQAKNLDAFLESNNVPYPSFEEDTFDQLPASVQSDCWALANSCNELKKLSRGPTMATMDIAFNWIDALGLRVVYHYELAHSVPLEGSASYAEIANASGLKESLCRRFIRSAMGNNIFTEDLHTKRVRHTAASRRLLMDEGLSSAVGLELEDLGPASSKLIEVWEKYGQDTGEQTESAFCLYNRTHQPVYTVLGSQPERGRRFGRAMHFFTQDEAWDLRHMLASFDWSSVDKPGDVIVDVGGGNGQVSRYLARHTTNTHFVVQDLPHVVTEGPNYLPDYLKDRIEFMVHDFFTAQSMDPPPTAFLLRWILHNWSDKYSIMILRSLVPAMRKGSKVLIYEYVLEDEPVTDITARFGFQMDGIMATFFNSQERTAKDFELLLAAVHENFFIENVCRPNGSTMSIVEVGWAG